jgi:hypothetical protein
MHASAVQRIAASSRLATATVPWGFACSGSPLRRHGENTVTLGGTWYRRMVMVDTPDEVLAFDPVEGLKDAILLPVWKLA